MQRSTAVGGAGLVPRSRNNCNPDELCISRDDNVNKLSAFDIMLYNEETR